MDTDQEDISCSQVEDFLFELSYEDMRAVVDRVVKRRASCSGLPYAKVFTDIIMPVMADILKAGRFVARPPTNLVRRNSKLPSVRFRCG